MLTVRLPLPGQGRIKAIPGQIPPPDGRHPDGSSFLTLPTNGGILACGTGMGTTRQMRSARHGARARNTPHRPAYTPRTTSRGRLIYNLVLSGIAALCGLILAIAPAVFGATQEARPLGGVLAGYGLVRGYYFYRRLRRRPANPA